MSKESLRYFNNAKEILKKASIEDDAYTDVKLVQEACGVAYLAQTDRQPCTNKLFTPIYYIYKPWFLLQEARAFLLENQAGLTGSGAFPIFCIRLFGAFLECSNRVTACHASRLRTTLWAVRLCHNNKNT